MTNVGDRVYEDAWLSAPVIQLEDGNYTLFWSKQVHVLVTDALDDLCPDTSRAPDEEPT
jgi:hypothetical protein